MGKITGGCKMRKLLIHKEYLVDTNSTEISDIHNELAEKFAMENVLPENEFWENLELDIDHYCSECGITLNLDEEKEDGICVSCDNGRTIKNSSWRERTKEE